MIYTVAEYLCGRLTGHLGIVPCWNGWEIFLRRGRWGIDGFCLCGRSFTMPYGGMIEPIELFFFYCWRRRITKEIEEEESERLKK